MAPALAATIMGARLENIVPNIAAKGSAPDARSGGPTWPMASPKRSKNWR
ncbi:MAG: hypothetical protein R2710_02475 [Acidimicrobiales bacterium]